MRMFVLPLLGGVLLGAGCVVTKAPESLIGEVASMARAGGWSATKEARAGVDRAWVKRFKDARLSTLVDEALRRNPNMRVAAERVQQAVQVARAAGASGRLHLSVETSARRRKFVFVGFPFGGSNISDNYGVNWMVNWEPDIWGRVSAGVSAAVADVQSAELERRAAESSLAAQVCKAWFALCEANEQLALAQEAEALRRKSVEVIQERFEQNLAGNGGGASELRLAQTNVATSVAEVSEKRGNVELARRRLELLVGRYPAGKVQGHAALPRIPSRPPAGLPSELLLRRPDILAAERRYAAMGMRIKEARLAMFPRLALTASTGTTADTLRKILSSDFGVWSIGANVTQNILTGGQVKSEVKRRSALQRQQLAELQAVVLKAFGEVETALVTDHWLAKRIGEMQKALRLARDAEEAANNDFSEGNVDALVVLTAQERRLSIESSVLLLRRLQLENRVNLHLALGGGFKPKPITKSK